VELTQELEHWLFPPLRCTLDWPRAGLRIICKPQPIVGGCRPCTRCASSVPHLFRPRTGEKKKNLVDLIDLNTPARPSSRSCLPAFDWEFIRNGSSRTTVTAEDKESDFLLQGVELLNGSPAGAMRGRLLMECGTKPVVDHGQVVELTPHLQNGTQELSFTQRIKLSNGEVRPPITDAGHWFAGQPPLAFVGDTFYLLRNAPPGGLLEGITRTPSVPVRKLSRPVSSTDLRRARIPTTAWTGTSFAWRIPRCRSSPFELVDEVIRIRLLARGASATTPSGTGTATNGSRDEPSHSNRQDRKSSTTSGSNPPSTGCAGSTASCRPSPASGSVMRPRTSSARSPPTGPAWPARRRFPRQCGVPNASSSRRASSSPRSS
jgi:hypothetical protein